MDGLLAGRSIVSLPISQTATGAGADVGDVDWVNAELIIRKHMLLFFRTN